MNTRAYSTSLVPALLSFLIVIGSHSEAMAETALRIPLKIRLYSSLTVGVSDKHAIAFTTPMLDLLSRQLGYPVEFKLAKGDAVEDLIGFGKELDQGTVHAGVVWGLEYGWLRDRFPRLEPLVLVVQHDVAHRCQVMVREDFAADDFSKLRGSRLAVFQRAPLQDELFLNKLMGQNKATIKTYFSAVKENPTALSAIFAVHQGEADCLVLGIMAYSRHVVSRPQLKLRTVKLSEPFPGPVVVGRPDRINGLRPALWKELQRTLAVIHRSTEGRYCTDFWRVERFAPPEGKAFEDLVRMRVRDYPVTVLQKLVPGDRR